jgi:hypothetical protein
MGFLLWGGNEGFTRNLEEEAHGFNKWQLELSIYHPLRLDARRLSEN